jgi:hypothetical protein
MTIKLYWWQGKGSANSNLRNFGDWLSPLICEAISRGKVVFADPHHCQLIAIGSILKKLHKTNRWFFRRKIAIWGTGSIGEQGTYSSHHDYHAVRGKLSRNKISSSKYAHITLGDPGLLCESVWSGNIQQKNFAVGLVPHYIDHAHPLLKELLNNSKHFTLINVYDHPIKVIEQIARCEMVLSSSLHGLIVADALQIPNAWIKLSNLIGPNDFKFHDYYSIYDISDIKPFPLSNRDSPDSITVIKESYKRPGLNQLKENLLNAFPF